MAMEDDEQQGGLKWPAFVLIGVVAAGIVTAAVIVVPKMMPEQSNELVIIKAQQGSIKVKPVDAGGQKIANQNSAVMDMLGDLNPSPDDVETLVPPSAAPELPATALTPEGGNTGVVEEPVNEVPQAATENTATAVAKAPEKIIVAQPKKVEEPPAPAVKEEPKKATPAPKKKPVAVDGNEPLYMVQLAAFRNPDVAAEQAGLLGSKHQSRMQGSELATMRIDAGENGIFWRIVSEPLPRAAADSVCASLKRAGQDCILRKFTSPTQ